MKKLLLFVLISLSATACTDNDANTPMQAALYCYQALIEERWDDYVNGTADGATLPDDVRRERIDVVRDYMEIQKSNNGGIKSAQAMRCTMINDSTSFVYVQLTFGDESCEEIYVPVVKVDGNWRVR